MINYNRLYEIEASKAAVKISGDLLIQAMVIAETLYLENAAAVAESKMHRARIHEMQKFNLGIMDSLIVAEWE